MAVRKSLTPPAGEGLVEVVQLAAPPATPPTGPFGRQDLGDGDLTWTDSQGIKHSIQGGWFGIAPAGIALLWFGSVVPDPGWWFAAGQAINAGTYPVCAGIYGTNLPNFTDRYLIGASGGTKPVRSTGGSSKITYGQMPEHTHGGVTKHRASRYTGPQDSGGWFSGDAINAGQQTDSAGSGQDYWPPYLAVNLIIKMG